MLLNETSSSFANIAREGDFNDFIKFEPVEKVHALKVRLESAVRKLAGTRTPVTEFLERRLREVRLVLQTA